MASHKEVDADGEVADAVIRGALSRLTDLIDPSLWSETIRGILPARFLEINLQAFQAGGRWDNLCPSQVWCQCCLSGLSRLFSLKFWN